MEVVNQGHVETLQVDEIPNLKGDENEILTRMENLEGSFRKVEEEISRIKEDIIAFKSALSQEVGELRISLDELETKTNLRMEKTAKESAARIENLEKSLTDLSGNIEQNTKELSLLETELSRKINKIDERIAEVQKDTKSTIKALEADLRENMDLLDRRIEDAKKALTDRIATVEQKIVDKTSDLSVRIESAAKKIEENRSEIERVTEKLTGVISKADENYEGIKVLKAQLKTTTADLSTKLKNLGHELEKALKLTDDNKKNIETMQTSIDEAMTKIKENFKRTEALNREIRKVSESFTEKLKENHRDITLTVRKLETETKRNMDTLDSKVAELEKSLSSRIDEEFNKASQSLNRIQEDLLSTINNIREKLETLTKVVEGLRDNINEIRAETENLREREDKRYKWTVDAIDAIVNKPVLRKPRIPEPTN